MQVRAHAPLGGHLLKNLVRFRLFAISAAGRFALYHFRDGMNGLIVWALATLLTGLVVLSTLQALPRLAQPSALDAGAANSVAGENLISFDLDRLFRGEQRPSGDLAYARAEAARILLTTSSHSGMQVDDRAYLVRLVAATTGLASADAEHHDRCRRPARRGHGLVCSCFRWASPRWSRCSTLLLGLGTTLYAQPLKA